MGKQKGWGAPAPSAIHKAWGNGCSQSLSISGSIPWPDMLSEKPAWLLLCVLPIQSCFFIQRTAEAAVVTCSQVSRRAGLHLATRMQRGGPRSHQLLC